MVCTENQKLDAILRTIYRDTNGIANQGCVYRNMSQIAPFADVHEWRNLLIDLNKHGYIELYNNQIAKFSLTKYGLEFCKTSSFSKPNVPIIKQM